MSSFQSACQIPQDSFGFSAPITARLCRSFGWWASRLWAWARVSDFKTFSFDLETRCNSSAVSFGWLYIVCCDASFRADGVLAA